MKIWLVGIILVVIGYLAYVFYNTDNNNNSNNNNNTNSNKLFIPSSEFNGKKDNYVFKKGDDGLGYYIDNK